MPMPSATSSAQRDVEQRLVDRDAAAQVPADVAGQRRPHLRTPRVVLDLGQGRGQHVRVAQHAAVEGDERDARAGWLARSHREGPDGVGTGAPSDEAARVLHQEPGCRGQPRLQRLDGERLQRLVEVDPGRDQRDPDEANQRERELERDAAADGVQERGQHQSSSNR
ncbi:MAG: hypothetical protein AUI04_01860 [Candidatus Rokubacteria bacterium 13_2_20CM_2_64_8]|nr:MAG: hypothetical protein AUI04_01860 [Candidatus Rokubacteria bacterium 13_2_20CM_2_64_8]